MKKKLDTKLLDLKCKKCGEIRPIRVERKTKTVICSVCGAKNGIK